MNKRSVQILADFSIVKKTVDIQTSVATCYKSFSLTQYASVWTRQLVLKFSDCNKSFKRKEYLKILIGNILYWNTFFGKYWSNKKKRESEREIILLWIRCQTRNKSKKCSSYERFLIFLESSFTIFCSSFLNRR